MDNINRKVDWKIVALILTLILIVAILSIILFLKFNLHLNDLNNTMLWGVVSGLSTFIITFIIINRFLYSLNDKILERIEYLLSNFFPHDKTTKTILNIVQHEYMTLVHYDRISLNGTGFYDDLYKNCREIKISGITLKYFFESLINKDHVIIEQLLKGNNLTVKILLLHPQSKFVEMLDKQEGTPQNRFPVKTKIMNVISLIEKFSEKDKHISLGSKCKLEIRLTEENINLTINYAQKKEKDVKDTLLMGLLFGHKQGGPLYRIPKDSASHLYEDCTDYFDKLYNHAAESTIFSWHESEGKKFTFQV